MTVNIENYLRNLPIAKIKEIEKSKRRMHALDQLVKVLGKFGHFSDSEIFVRINGLMSKVGEFADNESLKVMRDNVIKLKNSFECFNSLEPFFELNGGVFSSEEEKSRLSKYRSFGEGLRTLLDEDAAFIDSVRQTYLRSGTQDNPRDYPLARLYEIFVTVAGDETIRFTSRFNEFSGTAQEPEVTPLRLLTLVCIVIGEVRSEHALYQMIERQMKLAVIRIRDIQTSS